MKKGTINYSRIQLVVFVSFLLFFIFAPWIVSALTRNYETYKMDEVTDEEIVDMVNDCESVYLHRNRPSFGTNYDVVIDGKCVGNIKGKSLSLFNDTMTFTSVNGSTIAIAQEGFDLWRDSWVVTNSNDEFSIRIDANVSMRTSYDIFDANDEKIGAMTSNWFSIFNNGTIKDEDGNVAYKIKKKIFGNTYLEKVEESDISTIDAMMIITGFNKETEKSSSSSSSSKNSSK